ncbi:NUDIX hydrolase [Marivivens sp. LCG002]|uniref:NUDIX hydrolase n=1 Tax=Marivivens sp. LCG002 TaxID=3051171 RepID=UPI0025535185|nr:NUDIX hydrolase [Marivivens sp. LCG002]WIV51503.1 NUDIX hydrolase [Marivivens sp. LCG002]
MSDTPIRDAATLVVIKDRDTNPSILMGQRGENAAFMPRKFVFPGGAVDPVDATVPVAGALSEVCAERLAMQSAMLPAALAAAAIRELFEETGLVLGSRETWEGAPKGWRGYAATGHIPSFEGLEFIFRAVTPKGRPRRFDARFFLVDASRLSSDPDDFSRAEDELSHLQWIPLSQARKFDLPFITECVLAEVAANLDRKGPPVSVPFFRNNDEANTIARLGGQSPLEAYFNTSSRDRS